MARNERAIERIINRGIKKVDVPQSRNLYTGYRTSSSSKESHLPGYLKVTDDILKRLNINEKDALEIVSGSRGLSQTQQAMERIKKGAPIAIYDLETLGQQALGTMSGQEQSLFGITQMAVGISDSHDALSQGQIAVNNIVFRQSNEVKKELTSLLDSLENNWRSYDDLTDRQRGTLADLATFSQTDLFGGKATIGGKSYMTLDKQGQPIHLSKTALTDRDNIKLMRKGLENITNPELTTDPKEIVSITSHLKDMNAVMVGQNVERFDKPGLTQALKMQGASKEVLNYASNPQADILRMAQNVLNTPDGPKVRNYQLGTLYNEFTSKPYGEGQAHNAGFDVRMTAAVYDELSKHSTAGENVRRKTIESGDVFFTREGFNFFESNFNQNRGQYDMVTVINPDTGKHELQYDTFRRGTGRGTTLQFKGQVEPLEVDGVKHYGITMYNPDDNTYHHLFRANRGEIDDIFEQHLIGSKEASDDEKSYIQRDNLRRRYSELFTKKAKGASDTVSDRLDTAYEIIDVYKQELGKIDKTGLNADAIEETALNNTIKAVNKDRGKYALGKRRIEETVALRDILEEDKGIWNDVGETAKRVAGLGGTERNRTERENHYYKYVFNSLDDLRGPSEYGHDGLSMIQLPKFSQPGEFTYRNVSSFKDMQSFVGKELRQDNNRSGSGKTGVHFERMMDAVGDVLDREERNRMQRLVHRDLKEGNVSQGTIDEISGLIYRKKEILKTNGVIRNSVPGVDIEKAFANTVFQDGSDLTNKQESSFFNRIKQDGEEFVNRHIARGSTQANSTKLSNEVVKRLKTSDEVQKQLREGVVGMNESLGMNFGRREVFSKNKAQEKVEQVINNFESQGFQVKLEQVDGSNRMLLFATLDNGIDLTGMTIDQLQTHDRIFGAPLPLYNDNMSIDTVSGEMRDMQHIKVDLQKGGSVNNLTANDIRVDSTSDLIFDHLNYSASNIKKELKKGETIEDAIGKERGSLYRKSTGLGIPSGFRGETADQLGFTAASREANQMLLANSNAYFEAYAEENYPKKYRRFLSEREKDKDRNILDMFSAGELTRFRIEATTNWNQGIGAQTGIYLRPEGLNINQASKGVMNLMPASLSLPFGQMHSPIREQANKSINYRVADRAPMEAFFKGEYGDNSLRAQVATNPAQTAFSNRQARETGVRAYEMATLQAGDSVISEASQTVKENYQNRLSALRSKKELTPQEKREYDELTGLINFIDSGKMSTFEDQYAVSDQFLNSLSSSEHLEIDLNQYEITSELRRVLTNDGENELTEGRINFNTALSYSDMQSMGIVSEDGMFTVGQLSQDVIANNSGFEYSEAKRRRIQKGAELQGVEISPEGRATLIMNNRYQGMTGNKTLRTATGGRETGVSTPQQLIRDMARTIIGDSSIDNIYAITAFEKGGMSGRRGTGGMYTDLINTSAYNIRSAIDSLYDGNATSSGISGVDNYFKDRGTSGNRFKDYQDYIKNQFVPEVNKALGSEQIGFYDEAGAQAFEFLSPTLPGSPEERQGYLKNLTNLATDNYGLKMGAFTGGGENPLGDYMVTATGFTQHNIPYWQGQNVKARYGRVELDLIDQTLMGPSRGEMAKFRNFGEEHGVVAGIDMASYEGFKRRPGESIISQNLRELSQTTGSREEVEEYIRKIQSAKQFQERGGLMEEAARGGNVIVDIAGDYDFAEGSNFLTIGSGEDAYTIVDGSRIGVTSRGGMPTGADIRNTYRNIYSVELYGDGVETTIGDLVEEQNSSAFVRLLNPDHPLAQDAQLENEVVEVVPMLKSKKSTLGEVYLEQTEMSQAQAFEAAYEIIHGSPEGPKSDEWYDKRVRRLNQGMSNFIESSNKFIGSSAAQQLLQIREDNSFSANFQGRNILNTKYRVRDAVMNEQQARTLVRGRLDTILDANEISLSDIIGEGAIDSVTGDLLTSSEIQQAKEDYIINRLRGVASEDDEFEVFSIINRQPSQNEGSLIFGSIRIDDTGAIDDNYISLDPRFAAFTGGDFDGDIGYASSYPYLENMSKERAIELQAEMRQMANYSAIRAVVDNHKDMYGDIKEEGMNSLLNLLGMNDPAEIEYLFSDNLTDANAMLQIMSDETMRSNVGSIYNNVVGTRDAINMFATSAINASEGNLILDDMRSLSSNATGLMERIQQSAISRKKMEPSQIEEFMGFDKGYLSPSNMVGLAQSGELIDILTQFDEARANIPRGIRNITTTSAPEVMESLEKLNILSYKEHEDALRQNDLETLMGMGTLQEAMSTTPLGGFDNRFFRMGTSSASDEWMEIEEALMNTPEQVPVTSQTSAMAQAIFGADSETVLNWQGKQEEVMSGVTENYNRLLDRAGESVVGNRASRNLIEQLTASKALDGAGDHIRSQSALYNQAKSGLSAIGQSTAFRAAAGITAAWTVARAMSSGPTPEGNEAEQEMATAAEVSPSQLLTSPTARVAPGAQTVNLDIQASGNLSEQEVAGLINNEIGAMTGSPMEMNIHVNDNTAKLDRKFYQRAVDRVFGF